jgi:hypothetical protein
VLQEPVLQETDLHNSKFRTVATTPKKAARRGKRQPTSVADVLATHLPDGAGERNTDYGDDRQRLGAFLEDFAREFRDGANLRSTVSRAYNLWQQSGLPIGRFENLMFEARAVTKEWSGSITKPAGEGKLGSLKNKMPYFFRVLEDRVGRATGQKRLMDAPQEQVLASGELWEAILAVEKLQLPKETYDRWLAGSRQLDLSDDRLSVSVPSSGVAEFLTARLAARLTATAQKLSRRAIELVFVPPGAVEEESLTPIRAGTGRRPDARAHVTGPS